MEREDKGECNVREEECKVGLVVPYIRCEVVGDFSLSCGSYNDEEEDRNGEDE